MVEGEPSSRRYVAVHAEVEDSANKLNNVLQNRRDNRAGAVGEHVGEDRGNLNTAFEGIDDIDVSSMEFESTEEAESLYMMYARAANFGVRKGCRRKDKKGIVRVRSWFCNKENERLEKHT